MEVDHHRITQLTQTLRVELGLSHKTPALPKIEKWILTSWVEGFRAGWWQRDEYDKEQQETV